MSLESIEKLEEVVTIETEKMLRFMFDEIHKCKKDINRMERYTPTEIKKFGGKRLYDDYIMKKKENIRVQYNNIQFYTTYQWNYDRLVYKFS
jgi:hypothetical protein